MAGTAGISHAAESKKTKGNAQTGPASAGIRDPLNAQAYMEDLASRMDPDFDKTLLLKGTRPAKPSRAPAGQTAQIKPAAGALTPKTAVEGASQTRSTAAASPAKRDEPRSETQVAPRPLSQATPAQGAPSVTAGISEPKPPTPTVPAMGLGNGAQPAPKQPTPTVPATGLGNGTVSGSVSPAPGGAPVNPLQRQETMLVSPSSNPADRISLPIVPKAQPAPTPAAKYEAYASAGSPAPAAKRASPAGQTQNNADDLMFKGPGAVERRLASGTQGLSLWNEPGSANLAGQGPAVGPRIEAQASEPQMPWTLGGDLEKYRAHAVKEGSRKSGENLKKAFERAGMTLGDGVNIFVLGYASERAKPFRQNDGKGIFQEPGKVPATAGATVSSLGVGLYSLADLLALNALPDPNKPVYKDNNPFVRPVIFAGRTIGGLWKTTEEVGNAVTWGLFDNVTGCIGLVLEDIVELVKHAGQAVTNVARVPIRLVAGKKKEGADNAMDWVLLVPLELASNAVEMKGFSNMADYKNAFADKGVIGSVLEFSGSAYLVYRAADKVLDKRKKDKSSQNPSEQPGGQTPPPTPPPAVEPPAPGPGTEWVFGYQGVFTGITE